MHWLRTLLFLFPAPWGRAFHCKGAWSPVSGPTSQKKGPQNEAGVVFYCSRARGLRAQCCTFPVRLTTRRRLRCCETWCWKIHFRHTSRSNRFKMTLMASGPVHRLGREAGGAQGQWGLVTEDAGAWCYSYGLGVLLEQPTNERSAALTRGGSAINQSPIKWGFNPRTHVLCEL